MKALVIADHNGKEILKATRGAITAAAKITSDIDMLLMTPAADTTGAAQAIGVKRVLCAKGDVFNEILAETVSPWLADIVKKNGYTHVLWAATSTGKDVMPRVAALLDVGQISEITEVLSPDTFKRPIYAGNAIETIQTKDAIKIITVRGTAFDAAPQTGGNAEVILLDIPSANPSSTFVGKQESKSERPDLASARVVISGGRGMGSAENFKLLDTLATKLNAAIGASRAAVDAGYVPNDYQVGQTGKVVAPELYIAVGISGAIQHLAGMKDSKVIVAINKDENAPIFEIADYGLVGDLFQVVPELEKAL
jgi:electron transfer flavoprotein alpha subunit